MVSFVCDSCAATLKKAKVAQHAYSCGSYYYACIDCGETFDTDSIKAHNSCISEAQKHQGSMYKGPKAKQQQQPKAAATPAASPDTGKRARHMLDSSDDEEEAPKAKEKEKESSKKAKKEEAAVPAAAPAPAAAQPASFDALSSLQTSLSKKGGSLSLKKLRKAVVKAAEPLGTDKEAATKLLVQALLDNASNVTITWSDKKDE